MEESMRSWAAGAHFSSLYLFVVQPSNSLVGGNREAKKGVILQGA